MSKIEKIGPAEQPEPGPQRPRRVSRQREAGEVTRAETRRRLLAAATAEFAERGYVAATVVRIADRADVSVPTLYSAWGSKRALLRAMMEASVMAEEDTAVRIGRPPAALVEAITTHPTGEAAGPRLLVAQLAHRFRQLAERSAVGWQTYRDAATVDPDIAADWRQLMEIRRANIRSMIEMLPAAWLRPGIAGPVHADTAWVIASPDSHEMLVRQAGYTYDEYENWVAATLGAALLPD